MQTRALRALLIPIALLAHGCGRSRATGNQAAPPEGYPAAVAWSHDYEAALSRAARERKPLMVDFLATWCHGCNLLDETVFSRHDVGEASQDFVAVRVDGDKRPDLARRLAVGGYPIVLFLTPHGEEITRVRGAVPYQVMLEAMARASEKPAAPQTRPD
jgi:thiol:disulfide interchange protein